MANEPTKTPVDTGASAPASTPHVFRTFAQDIARVSGKPLAKNEPNVPAPSKPIATKQEPEQKPIPAPTVTSAAPTSPAPIPDKPKTPPTPPPKPAPEPPPAYIIPKAPSTNETREAVLARLKKNAETVNPPVTATPISIAPKAPSTDETREAVLARLRKASGLPPTTPFTPGIHSAPAARTPEPVAAPIPVKAPEPMKPAPIPVPEAPILRPPLPVQPFPQNQPPAVSPIHTYKSDFADHIDSKGASTFSVLAAQADAGQLTEQTAPKKFPLAVAAGVVLILIGAGGVFFALSYVANRPAVVLEQNVPSLIFADERAEIKAKSTGAELVYALALNAVDPLPEGKVRITYLGLATTTPAGVPITEPLPGGALISAMLLPAPDILLRNIEPESTVGIVNAGGDTRAFFILRVSSFERTFAGMLEWEKTVISDLALLYPPYIPEVQPLAPEATSTTSASIAPPTPLIAPSFKDEIIANHDARVLRDALNRTLMVYGYRDKTTLVIARNEAAFTELLRRLATSATQ